MTSRGAVVALAVCLVFGRGVSAAAVGLPFYNSAEFTPHWLVEDDPALTGFHQVGEFELMNQFGETISSADVAGRIYVASFFFSTCPGICPAIRSKLSQVQDHFANDPDLLILSHSIRPETDTPAVLLAYAESNNVVSERWHLLTGDRQALYRLARDSYFANEDLGEIQSNDDFLHTENLLLIDRKGRIRGIYNGLSESSVRHLIADIEQLQAD